ncbi:type II toxin-antitoxin system RelE/ParE family toxin [Guyparkeria sp.]|uniref:type II toxin-antitoxin system RelE/ParE family toxin n=1 Tax=Guyparkeria sp. TaxID=2035736 RepID=UPI0039708663
MIKSFKDKTLERCWRQGRCNRIPANLRRRILMKLDVIEVATCIEDLEHPPGNHLHTLNGKGFAGCWAISVNGPWRIVFRFEGGHVYDVQLVQYH